MRHLNLDVVATRGDHIESRHRIHAAVVDENGKLIAAANDAGMVTYWRSCAKPFQVMPLLESGGFDRVKWGNDELALACASHGGEPEHVAIAGAMLESLGMEEGDLACGPHEPLSPRGARLAREAGIRFSRLHNNCSGKHAAMLARAHTEGWSTEGYEREDHRVQQSVVETISTWTGVPVPKIVKGIDGCGATVFAMPLEAMARSYARLAAAAARGEEVPGRVVEAMATRPFLVGGSERFDSMLIEATRGRIIAKVGAEGVHCAAVLDMGVGVVVKAEDGAQRAHCPALLRVLQHLGALPDLLPDKLEEFLHRAVRNTRGETVGHVRPLS